MPIERLGDLHPVVAPTAFVHPGAWVLGDVEVKEDASVWPTAVLRGDSGRLLLGAGSNLQDGAVVHATTGVTQTTIGRGCTIGHRVVLHGCSLGDQCLVGMGSIVLDGAEVGEGSFVAAGALITPRKAFPPHSFIIGSPAKRLRAVTAEERQLIEVSWQHYVELAKRYLADRSASSR